MDQVLASPHCRCGEKPETDEFDLPRLAEPSFKRERDHRHDLQHGARHLQAPYAGVEVEVSLRRRRCVAGPRVMREVDARRPVCVCVRARAWFPWLSLSCHVAVDAILASPLMSWCISIRECTAVFSLIHALQ